jgi:endo-1,4-beta-xylanase
MDMTRRSALERLAAGALASACAAALPMHAGAAEAATESLRELARRKGLRVGNAMGNGAFRDPAYRALMARECNAFVCENATKWKQLQPRAGQFDFVAADEMLAWAKAQEMRLRGHTLVWQGEKWLPAWVNEHDFGAQPGKEAERLLREHIGTVCDHFGAQIASYDVVNEAIEPKTGALRQNVLTTHLGALEQIDLAFRLARAHAPGAQLVYNDYMGAGDGSAKHRAGVLALLQALKARGTPVQALGIQSHITAPARRGVEGMGEWRRFLDEVSGMGLDLLITELDVNDRQLAGEVALRDAGVAAATRDYLDMMLSYPNLRDVMLWGMADHVSWLKDLKEHPRTDGLLMRPCPFDARLQAKPMRAAIADAFKAMPARAGAQTS